MAFTIDVDEGKWSKKVLQILLTDRTTNRNIIWGTGDYESLGEEYYSHFPILFELITGKNSGVIQPRILKTKESQGNRTRGKAEVFTPSWVCNTQNNLVDTAWFEVENTFNIEIEKGWKTNREKIKFPDKKNKTWQKYVDEKRLEITCGEAPYLVSRYDTVSGAPLGLKDRIGILDRKMRVVCENTYGEKEWLKWAERAFQSVYGFEFQGDSLLIARENLLASYCDYMQGKLNREPTEKELINIAKIISWNLWQMDGLTHTIPYEKSVEPVEQITLFDFREEDKKSLCIIKDWRAKRIYTFQDLLNKGGKLDGQNENRRNRCT
ncbi:TPA: restriction endonuclease subunit M [Streptococcus suis]|nr:restriction endonuclease subunit M [Streptococcus suis]HEM3703058.1 restriction endonuclease subunit M [Streptococcus suis]